MSIMGTVNTFGSNSLATFEIQRIESMAGAAAAAAAVKNLVQTKGAEYAGAPIVLTGAAYQSVFSVSFTKSAASTKVICAASVDGVLAQAAPSPPIDAVDWKLLIDGVDVQVGGMHVEGESGFSFNIERIGLSAGVHTFEIQGKCSVAADTFTIAPPASGFATIVLSEVRV